MHLTALYLNHFEQAEKYFQLYQDGLGENTDLFSDRLSRLKLLTEIRGERWQEAAKILADDFQTHGLYNLRILYPESFIWRIAQVAAHIGQYEFSSMLFYALDTHIVPNGSIESIYQPEYTFARKLAYSHLEPITIENSGKSKLINMHELLNFVMHHVHCFL